MRLQICGGTALLGVFGWPVQHSLSPAMHNAAIADLGLDLVYLPFAVEPSGLGVALRALPALGVRGVNLTIPHKEAAIAYMDELEAGARALGAVNTVRVDAGRLVGTNTDGEGFAAPLRAVGFGCRGCRAVVLGAGGAARAVVRQLVDDGARVTVVNRSPERAVSLVNAVVGGRAEVVSAADVARAKSVVTGADLLVNTTPIGMSTHSPEALPIPPEWLRGATFVYDLVYRPALTPLLLAAESLGCRTLGGLGMLVHQGAAAFRFWTGLTPRPAVMLAAAMAQMDGG